MPGDDSCALRVTRGAVARLNRVVALRSPRVPAWVSLLLGWCLGRAALLARDVAALRGLADGARATGAARAFAPPSPAALRAIEGVGDGLALDIARHLWLCAGDPGAGRDRFDEVPGVGAVLAARLASALPPVPHRSPSIKDGLDSGDPPMPEVTPRARPELAPEALERAVTRVLRAALAEDLGVDPTVAHAPVDLVARDVTTRTAVPSDARARATLLVKGAGVLAGLDVFERAIRMLDPDARFDRRLRDGAPVAPLDVAAVIEGRAQALLVAERTALNLLQRLSGVASMTARCVALAAGRARILDTRKTTPGLRLLEKAAVLAGGGENHRIGLFDEAMVKENHVELAGRTIEDVLVALRRDLGPRVRITCEARDRREALAAVRGGADVVLLDNMSVADMAALAPELRAEAAARGRAVELEASGGVNERTLPAIAACGVDRVSIGALTHSAPALDISLELEPLRPPASRREEGRP